MARPCEVGHVIALARVSLLGFVVNGLPAGGLGVAWPFMRNAWQAPLSALGTILAAATVAPSTARPLSACSLLASGAICSHRTIALPALFAISFVALLRARGLPPDGHWRGQRTLSLWLGMMLLLILVGSIVSMGFNVPVGISQRIFFATWTVWFAGMGIWLLRLSSRPAGARHDVVERPAGRRRLEP